MSNQDVTKKEYYDAMSRLLTRYMERENITISKLATRVKLSFRTIQSILKGRPFYAHQFIWIEEETGITSHAIIKEARGGKEKQKETKLSEFI